MNANHYNYIKNKKYKKKNPYQIPLYVFEVEYDTPRVGVLIDMLKEKEIVAEIVREKMLRLLDKEVPHGTAVEIIKMKYNKNPKIIIGKKRIINKTNNIQNIILLNNFIFTPL